MGLFFVFLFVVHHRKRINIFSIDSAGVDILQKETLSETF